METDAPPAGALVFDIGLLGADTLTVSLMELEDGEERAGAEWSDGGSDADDGDMGAQGRAGPRRARRE